MSHDDANKHVIIPIRIYLVIALALLVGTVVTVVVASFDFGSWNIVIALIIAGVKASLVVLYFMHLKYDNRIYGLIFLTAIAFLAVFIALTMADTDNRSALNEYRSQSVREYAAIYDDTGQPLPMDQRKNIGPSAGAMAGSSADGQASDVPFEIQHGFGPIKEVVEVGPLDTARALSGKPIFESKCATCHKLDERYTGPPLRNVTAYRSATFIMNQILDPAQNVAKHPDMQGLLKIYYTYMTNQNVDVEQARTLVEYLRWEAGQPPVTKAAGQ